MIDIGFSGTSVCIVTIHTSIPHHLHSFRWTRLTNATNPDKAHLTTMIAPSGLMYALLACQDRHFSGSGGRHTPRY
ncbi:hypothetical protein AFLA_004102 [Aspergillus flavus NRRL3357]|nr:hypothetical protein AFLA_004102 [Aspergillus flavus NRRL3357]